MTLNDQSLNLNARQIILKTGNGLQLSTYVGPLGELIYDTTIDTLRIMDGVTEGGIPLPTTLNVEQVANISAQYWANVYSNSQAGNLTSIVGNLDSEVNLLTANILSLVGNNALFATNLANLDAIWKSLNYNTGFANATTVLINGVAANLLIEQSRAVLAETSLSANITAQAAIRAAADTAINASISTYNLNLAQEIANRAANNVILQDNIDDVAANIALEAVLRAGADFDLQSNIDAVSAARIADINGLRANLTASNVRIATLESDNWFLANGFHQVKLLSSGNLEVPNHILPRVDVTYDLGSPTQAFRDIYLSSSTIHMGTSKITIDPVSGLQVLTPAGARVPLIGNVRFPDNSEQTTAFLPSFITNEATIRSNEDTDIRGNVSALTFSFNNFAATVLSQIAALSGGSSNLAGTISAIVSTLNTALAQEITRATTAEGNISASLAGEINTRSLSDLGLTTTIGNVQANLTAANVEIADLQSGNIANIFITAPDNIATLTLENNVVFTVSNTLTLTGGNNSNIEFYLGGNVVYRSYKLNTLANTSSSEFANVITDATGTGNLVFSANAELTTPNIGTPTFGNLFYTNNLPVMTGISGMVPDMEIFLSTATSANLANVMTDATGTGNLVFSANAELTTPNIGTPTFANLFYAIDLPIGTGVRDLADNVAVFLSGPTSSNLGNVMTDATGTGNLVFSANAELTTPNIGTPTFANLFYAIDLPIGTGVRDLADNVAVFLSGPTSSNLGNVMTDATGTGNLVFSANAKLTTPNIGTPTFANLFYATDLPVMTGISGLATHMANFLATGTSSNLSNAVTSVSGTAGSLVFSHNSIFTGTSTFGNISSGNVSIGYDLVVTGNFTVNGTTTTINSTTLSVDDKNVILNDGTGTSDISADGGGITLKGTTDKTINWSVISAAWTSSENFAVAAGKTVIFGGGTSGTTALQASATASGTLTLPAAIDTLVGRNTTDTLTNKTLTAPNIGTPSFAVLTNATGLPVNTGISGMAAGVADFLANPTGTNLLTAMVDDTGSGKLVFDTSPVLVTPTLGVATATTINGLTITTSAGGTLSITAGKTLASLNSFTLSGTDGSLIQLGAGGTVAYTGSSGSKLNAFASTSSSELAGVISDETGTGSLVFATSPTLTTPVLGTPTSVNLLNATNLPVSTGISGLASGIATFLATPSSNNLLSAITDETGTGALVFATSPTLVTPSLGTPTSVDLLNATNLPVSTGISGLASGVATFLATPSSSNLLSAITDETGTGALVFATSPTLVTPTLGAALATSINGLTISSSTGTLTIANGKTATLNNTLIFNGTDASTVNFGAGGTVAYTGLSGAKLDAFGSTTSSELAGVISDETGTGSLVFATSPTLVTPILGTPQSVNLLNATNLPVSTGISGLGTGVATFLATPSSSNLLSAVTDETGTGSLVFATSPTLVTPILGTPQSVNLLNATNLPVSTGISGLGTGVATFLATPSSSNLLSAVTDETGTGSLVFATSPTLVTPILGTPQSVNLLNATNLPVSTGISGLGTGVATFLATPSSSNLLSAITDETGTGDLVFATSPTLVTPVLGTPTSVNLLNATNLPVSTGISGLASGVATFLATPSSSNLLSAITDETGTGALVFATSPTLVTPVLGTPQSVNLLNATNLPVSTGISGLGTGVASALAINVGSAGAFVEFNGALGTPSSATLTNATGLPVSGLTGLGTGVATFLATPTSNNLLSAITDETGTGALLFANSPTMVTPILGTPQSVNLANATNLPISTGVSGLGTGVGAALQVAVGSAGAVVVNGGAAGTPSSISLANGTGLPVSTGISGLASGVATFLGSPSSLNLASVLGDETGSGALVFATSPTLVTPVLGVASATSINKVAITTPATSATLTIVDGKTLTVSNTLTFTGTDSSSVAFGTGGTVAYTGAGGSKLNAFASTSSSELAGVISDETGTGSLVFATSPTLVTPTLGVASATSVSISSVLTLTPQSSAPGSPSAGMVAVADGSGWDPAGTGKSVLVVYLASGWRVAATAP